MTDDIPTAQAGRTITILDSGTDPGHGNGGTISIDPRRTIETALSPQGRIRGIWEIVKANNWEGGLTFGGRRPYC